MTTMIVIVFCIGLALLLGPTSLSKASGGARSAMVSPAIHLMMDVSE
jgi:hypothetical protein